MAEFLPYIGDRVTATVTFTDADDVATDATVVAYVFKPDGTSLPADGDPALTVTHGGTGIYSTDVDIDDDGTWVVRFEATGTLVKAIEGEFSARRSVFYP